MSKLLDDLIKQSRADTVAYEAFLKKAEELVKRMARKDAVAGVSPVLHGKPEATVIYNNLPDILAMGTAVIREDSPLEQEERAALALKIDQAMREKAQAGWKDDQAKESIVKTFLHELMNKNRHATLAIFDIIKNQPGY